jgi:heavy metal sensor kinase
MSQASLRAKLSWMHGLVIAFLIVVVSGVRYLYVEYASARHFDARLLHDAQILVPRLRLADDRFDLSKKDLSQADIFSIEGLATYFVMTDVEGQIVRRDLESSQMATMLECSDLSHILKQHSGFGQVVVCDGTPYRFVSLPVSLNGFSTPLFGHFGRSMESFNALANQYVSISIFTVPFIFVISVGVAWFLSGRALRPFDEVARTAERVNSENLNTQIATTRPEVEIQRLAQAFNGMVRRLNASFQQMRKFNADVAHELLTPFAIMRGEMEIALQAPDLKEEPRSVLISNLEELDRLTRIVTDMLTLAEADAGARVLAKKPTNLRPLIEDLVEQMRLLASDRNVEIVIRNAADFHIEADQLWIRRALLNLLDNAIKYSKDSGTVEVWSECIENQVRVRVRDDGIGISEKDIPHIFDRLYRADPARSRASGGAGLGLSLVKWIVEAHDGSIHVSSTVDRGTTFELLFPLLSSERGGHRASANNIAQ